MKILAIMQNQWFKDVPRMERMLRDTFKGDRPRFIRTFLFWSCRTGKVLKSIFGEDLCDEIIWEEASPIMGGSASSSFGYDVVHIAKVIHDQKPDLIIAFGVPAWEGLVEVMAGSDDLFRKWESESAGVPVIRAPHPCARDSGVPGKLESVAAQVKRLIAESEQAA